MPNKYLALVSRQSASRGGKSTCKHVFQSSALGIGVTTRAVYSLFDGGLAVVGTYSYHHICTVELKYLPMTCGFRYRVIFLWSKSKLAFSHIQMTTSEGDLSTEDVLAGKDDVDKLRKYEVNFTLRCS